MKKKDSKSKKKSQPSDSDLPLYIDILINQRLEGAEQRLRDNNKVDFEKLRTDFKNFTYKSRKEWVSVTFIICSILFAIFFYFFNKFITPKWIETKIEERTVKPKVEEMVSNFTKEELEPVRATFGSLTSHIELLQLENLQKQEQLEKDQIFFKKLMNIQQLALAARSDIRSKEKYLELEKLKTNPNYSDQILQDSIGIALREIGFYFDNIKYSLSGPSLKYIFDFGYSVDELVYKYRYSQSESDEREAAINTLIYYYKNGCVLDNIIEELCESIFSEKNLRVIARTTFFLQELTKDYFNPLDFQFVSNWWEVNKEQKYESPFKNYLEARKNWNLQDNLTETEKLNKIELLNKAINDYREPLHARCLLAYLYITMNNDKKAEDQLNNVAQKNQTIDGYHIIEYCYIFREIKLNLLKNLLKN